MKKIEIEIACVDNVEKILSSLRMFLINTRIFLVFFIADILAQVALVYVLY